MRMKITMRIIYFVFFMQLSSLANALVFPIDLNDFYSDLEVIVSVDGVSAEFSENIDRSGTVLENNPLSGNPKVILPSPGTTLSFEYDFFEATNNDDGFDATLFNAVTNESLETYFTDTSDSGAIEFDLSPYTGDTLGLIFGLISFDSSTGSLLRINDLNLQVVPIPSSFILFLSAIPFLFRRKIISL